MAISEVYATNGDNTVAKPAGISEVFITNMPEGGGSGGVTSINGQTGDVTLTASDVGALPSSTVIPSKTSDLQNDSGYITASDVPAQVQSDWNEADTTDPAYIKNKPSIPAAQVNSDWNASSGVAEILNKPTLATVATSGSYNDLSNTPTINNVPTVTSSDDGKVLTASYTGGIASYSWAAGSSGSESVKVLEINDSNIYDAAIVASIVQFVIANAPDHPIILNQIVGKGTSGEYSKLYYLNAYRKENTQGISGNYPVFSFAEGYAYNDGRYINYLYFSPYDDGEGNISYTVSVDTNSFDYSGNSIYNYGTISLNTYQLEETFNGNDTQNRHIFFYVEKTDFSAADQALLFASGTEANIMLDGLQLIRNTSTLEITTAKFYGVVEGAAANSKYMITATFDYSSDPWAPGTKTLTVQDLSAGGGSSTPSVEVVNINNINTRFASYNAMYSELSSGTKSFVFIDSDKYFTVSTYDVSRAQIIAIDSYDDGNYTNGNPIMYMQYMTLRKDSSTGKINATGLTQFYSAAFKPVEWVGTYINQAKIPVGSHYINEIKLASYDGKSVNLFRCKGDYTESSSNAKIYDDTTNWERIKLDTYLTKLRTSVRNGIQVPSNGTLDILSEWENNVIVLDTTNSDPLVINNSNSVPNLVLQWTVNSSTTLPTMPSGYHGASANPSSLTVGKTYQLSLLNNCYSIVEFA